MSEAHAIAPTSLEPAPDSAELMLGANGLLIFQRFALVVFWTVMATLAYGIPTYGVTDPSLVTASLLGVSCLLARRKLRHGKATQGIQIMLWSLSLTVLLSLVLVAGLRTPIVFVVPSLCMFAAWLLGERTAIGVFAMFALAMAAMAVAESFFGYVPPSFKRTPIGTVMVMIPATLLGLLISIYAFRSFKDKIVEVLALTDAQKVQLEELRLSEERFANLFRAMPAPSSTVDEFGRTKDVNDAWVELFGIARDDAIGKTTQELGLWADEGDRDRVLDWFDAQGRVSGMPVSFKTATGVRPFLLYLAPVEYAGRQRKITSLVDQTDRLAAEAAQRAVTEELEVRVTQRTAELSQTVERLTATQEELVQSEKLASLGAMVAGISHELNTPIGNTVTVASTLQAQIKDFKKLVDSGQLRKSDLAEFLGLLDEMSDVIVRSTRRAAELVASFKQVAVDRSSERRREFDVATLVHELVTALKPGMRHRDIAVSLDVPMGIECDSFPGPVGQVITNLIQNALTHAFTEEQAGTIAITVHTEGPHKVVMLVRDNGRGMDEHTLKHAFDPFFTTRLGQGGSGLGLSVSHRIAQTVLGGNLTATSTPGQGTTFTFSFLRLAPK